MLEVLLRDLFFFLVIGVRYMVLSQDDSFFYLPVNDHSSSSLNLNLYWLKTTFIVMYYSFSQDIQMDCHCIRFKAVCFRSIFRILMALFYHSIQIEYFTPSLFYSLTINVSHPFDLKLSKYWNEVSISYNILLDLEKLLLYSHWSHCEL